MPERFGGGSGRSDISYVGIEVVDGDGRVLPDYSGDIELNLAGPGELIAFGSGNPLAVGSYQARATRTWRGRALAVVRGTGKAGKVRIEVRGAGLRSGAATLKQVSV
jgi:beta-galactosidase